MALEAAATEDLIDAELHEVTSALYNTTFADRLVTKLQFDVSPGLFFLVDGIHDINAAGTQGMQPGVDVDTNFGFFPTSIDVVQLTDGAVLRTITDQDGISGFQWDPQTGEILTLGFSGQLSWHDSATFEVTRTIQVEQGAMFLERVGDLLAYRAITNAQEIDLQTHVIDAQTGSELFAGPPDAFLSHLSPSGEMVAILDDSRSYGFSTSPPGTS